MSMFKDWWKHKTTEKKVDPVDLSLIGVDMHSHLLPGIDDGAKDIEDSMMLIQHLHQLGYSKFITTPHIFQDMYKNSPETILPALELVRAELKNREIPVTIDAAAEYYCDDLFERLIDQKGLLTFGENYVLFEISFAAENANLGRAIFNMRLNGYRPILAHPERYDYWHHDFARYESMIDKDVLLQINMNSLTGQYGPSTKRTAERLIEKGMVSFVGTDCHHMGHVQLTNTARTNPYLKMLIESGNLKHNLLMK
jgi:protein-tyrosine phosphatase